MLFELSIVSQIGNEGNETAVGEGNSNSLTVVSRRTRRVDVEHYVQRKLLAPMARVLGLAGVDVRDWLLRCNEKRPRPQAHTHRRGANGHADRSRITAHFASDHCA